MNFVLLIGTFKFSLCFLSSSKRLSCTATSFRTLGGVLILGWLRGFGVNDEVLFVCGEAGAGAIMGCRTRLGAIGEGEA